MESSEPTFSAPNTWSVQDFQTNVLEGAWWFLGWNTVEQSWDNGIICGHNGRILKDDKRTSSDLKHTHVTFNWLVVSPPLKKNMKVNWNDDIPNIWKIKVMFQTANIPINHKIINYSSIIIPQYLSLQNCSIHRQSVNHYWINHHKNHDCFNHYEPLKITTKLLLPISLDIESFSVAQRCSPTRQPQIGRSEFQAATDLTTSSNDKWIHGFWSWYVWIWHLTLILIC